MKFRVIGSYTIYIRSQYNGGSIIGLLKGGDEIEALEIKDKWVKHNKIGKIGWSVMSQNGKPLMEAIADVPPITTVSPQVKMDSEEMPEYEPVDYTKLQQEITNANEQNVNNFIKNIRGIYGLPYQFMSSVDRRVSGSDFGRKYAEKIITNMPLLLISPGKPKFMKSFSISEKKDILRYIKQKDTNFVDEVISGKGRYYSFEFNYAEFYQILNPMAQVMSRFLNIQDRTIDGQSLDTFKWQNYTNSTFKNFINAQESLAFYIDSETQISESFSNNTGQSMLANQANQLSDTAREIQFLIGGISGAQFEKVSQDSYGQTLSELDNFSNKYLKALTPDSLINRLQSGLLTVATGGKLIFPEIWNESSFSRNYGVNIKLRTPDSDNFSWFMNIGLPMLVCIALTAPQQMDANSYKSPFLVRAFYKGFFNVDMGIITSMNITKGSNAKWTANGLPTEVDISLDIKDLYDVFMTTQSKEEGILQGAQKIINNTYLID
jgi:23S rRNA pseudoU1915 N3-methylase RlmH